MPVETELLPLAIMAMTVCLPSGFGLRVIVTVFWELYCLVRRKGRERMVYASVLLLVLAVSFPLPIKEPYSGRVIVIRDNYCLVQRGMVKILIYVQDDQIDLDDQILIDCQLSQPVSYDNFERSGFNSWVRSENIAFSATAEKLKIINKGNTIRGWLYRRIRANGSDWISSLLFGSGLDYSGSNGYLMISSGMHVSFLASLIRKQAGRYFHDDKALKITVGLMSLLGLIFHFPFSYQRTVISLVSELIFEKERKQRVGFTALMLMILKPYGVCSLSFLMSQGIRIINCYGKSDRISTTLYFLAVQLYINGYCDLISLLSFPLLRQVYGWGYALALICGTANIRLPLGNLLEGFLSLCDSLNGMMINGQLSLMLFAGCVIVILEYMQNHYRRYLVIAAFLLMINSFEGMLNPFYTVTFLDVGQGDSAIITSPFSVSAVMIDTGGSRYKDVARDILIPYLRRSGIYSLDVIVSHDDIDHCGSLDSLQENWNVRNVYRVKQEVVKHGLVKIYDPLYDLCFENENDNSLVSWLNHGGFGFLFLGDISADVEEIIVERYRDLKVNVVKLAHHGSSSSSGEEMLGSYLPDIAVISAGRGNRYGHPARETLERLDAFRIKALDTRLDGAIRMTVLPGMLLWQSASGRIGVIFSHHKK